jgi:hypothetical protein
LSAPIYLLSPSPHRLGLQTPGCNPTGADRREPAFPPASLEGGIRRADSTFVHNDLRCSCPWSGLSGWAQPSPPSCSSNLTWACKPYAEPLEQENTGKPALGAPGTELRIWFWGEERNPTIGGGLG